MCKSHSFKPTRPRKQSDRWLLPPGSMGVRLSRSAQPTYLLEAFVFRVWICASPCQRSDRITTVYGVLAHLAAHLHFAHDIEKPAAQLIPLLSCMACAQADRQYALQVLTNPPPPRTSSRLASFGRKSCIVVVTFGADVDNACGCTTNVSEAATQIEASISKDGANRLYSSIRQDISCSTKDLS